MAADATTAVHAGVPDVSVVLDDGHQIVSMSPAARVLGEFTGDRLPHLAEVVGPPDLRRLLEAVAQARREGCSDAVAVTFVDGRGRRRAAEAVVEHPADPVAGGVVVRLGAGELQRPLGSRAFAGVIARSTEAIVVCDRDWRVIDCSPSVRSVLGLDPERLLGRVASAGLVHPSHRDAVVGAGLGVLGAGPGATMVERMRVEGPDGRQRWLETRLTNLLEDPLVMGIVANTRNVTEEQEALDELRRRAEHDALTGLPDRGAIESWLRDELDRLPGDSRDSADTNAGTDAATGVEAPARRHLLLVDLDGFQEINDTYGHGVGDQVLLRVSQRLARSCGGRRLGRFGGDEFVVLSEPGEDPEALATTLRDAVVRPLDGVSAAGWQLGLGVGSTEVVRAGDPGELLRRADVALVAAKASGRSVHVAYDGALDAAQTERRLLGQQLRRALHDGQFEMRFQPIVDLADGGVVACEALVRWRHPWRGVLEPTCFMHAVEDEGLQGELDLWVAEQVVLVAADWARAGYQLDVGLNVSGQGLARGFARHLSALLRRHGLPADRLTVELMETIRPRPEIAPEVDALRELGVRLAIDDFGTGYSSLASLQRLDAVALKLDGVFVDGVESDDGSRAIIRAAVSIARTFDMRVVAEWVQRRSQRDALLALGVDEGQGSLFGGPLTAGDFERTHLSGRGGPSGQPADVACR